VEISTTSKRETTKVEDIVSAFGDKGNKRVELTMVMILMALAK